MVRLGEDWLAEVRKYATASVLALLARDTQIEFGHIHDDVVVLGASALLMEQQLGPGAGPMIATSDGPIRRGLVAGVDVGGTKTSLVVTDDDDRVLYEHVAPTNRSAVVGQIAGLVDDAQRELQREVAAVGVAIPGHVDPQDGSVSMAVNLGITHLALGPMLQTELGMPTFVEHDARAAALWLSKQPGLRNGHAPSVAFLAIGTGISAGVVLDGEMLRGANGFAGEVGHVVADPDGSVCACGLRGCLETVAAGPAIGRQANEAIAAGRHTVLSQ